MKDNQFEQLINEVVIKTNNTQMTEEEYRYLSSYLGNKNFLVFGTGYDSNLWRYINKKGKIIFLENDPNWIDSNESDVLKVNYTCKRNHAFNLLHEFLKGNDAPLQMILPDKVIKTEWDVIFVDSPWDGDHGRMQSIFAASQLSTPSKTHIFLHDCNRPIENVYGYLFLGQLKKEFTKLRHYIK